MVMTSDFYTLGIWRFRVRVPAGVLGNFFGKVNNDSYLLCLALTRVHSYLLQESVQAGGSEKAVLGSAITGLCFEF